MLMSAITLQVPARYIINIPARCLLSQSDQRLLLDRALANLSDNSLRDAPTAVASRHHVIMSRWPRQCVIVGGKSAGARRVVLAS
jgi:hypothetical protein